MGVGQLIRNVITVETDPTVANFTKSLTSNNTILTAVNAASGTISASVLPSYVDDVLNFANLAAFPVAGETGKIYVTEDNNKTYRWSGSVYVEISSSATAGEALKLTNARTISTTGDATYSVSFDGSANVSSAITLATVNSNVGAFGGAGSIPVVTVNGKGQITAVSTNSIGNELIAIQALADTAGFLKKTGDGNYSIDNNNYLPLSGGTVTGDLASTSATASTSTTTGAIRAASLGVTGAIFANTVSANSYNLIPVGRGAGGVNSNTVIGVSSLQANTTGTNCSAFGVSSLQANTTGNYCSAFGVSSLQANTTGSSLTAVGVNSLQANTTGSSLTAVGVGSLQNNTTGNNSTASGVGALFGNTTGTNLAGFGFGAGRFQADGVTGLTASSNSCFIGTSTKGTQNATNENVFGFNATGSGSNTVTIGDSAITNTYLRGVISTNSTTTSTSTTTGAICAASLGITGAIFAGSLNGNRLYISHTSTENLSANPNWPSGTLKLEDNSTFDSGIGPSIIFYKKRDASGNQSVAAGITAVGVASSEKLQFYVGSAANLGLAKMTIQVDGNVGIGTVSPSQKLDIDGSAKATSFVVGTNQVVSSRRTGWSAPTGTATRTTFATSTVTLPQLAERVKALIDDLMSHGLIGA
jgi:uncharacterized membrane protein YeaQ/YmgE (transglycosylase-associated protein family)